MENIVRNVELGGLGELIRGLGDLLGLGGWVEDGPTMWMGWIILMLDGVGEDADMETGDTWKMPLSRVEGVTVKVDGLRCVTNSTAPSSLLLRSGPWTVRMFEPRRLRAEEPSLTSGTGRRTGNFLPNLGLFFFLGLA